MQQEFERIVLDLHYLPCIDYFLLIINSKEIVIENAENYVRHTYRNRCKILTADNILELSVPVKHEGKKLFKEVEIDYNQKWLQVHQRSIISAYRNAPYFEYYWPLFESVYSKKHSSLFDMNLEFLTLCLKLFRLEKNISFSNCYIKGYEDVFDGRDQILPKKSGINEPSLSQLSYKQVFGRDFVNNMSIIDLLFCEGNNALNIMKKSKG